MDDTLSPSISVASTGKVTRWLSLGGLASVPAWPVLGILTSDRDIWFHINSVINLIHDIAEKGWLSTLLPPFIALMVVVIGVLAGSAFVSKVGSGYLNKLPRIVLFFLGFFLGLLLVIVGVFSIFLMVGISLFGLDDAWDYFEWRLRIAAELPRPLGFIVACVVVAPFVAVIAIFILFKMVIGAIL